MTVRPLTLADTEDVLTLYLELTAGPKSASAADYAAVLGHPGTSVIGAEVDGHIRSMVTLHLLPNVTWEGRPYGVIENVITATEYRNRGLGRKVIEAALQTARQADAYKVMLQTGHARGAAGFYRACGFSDRDKIAMQIRWT